jgi:hypothetical protein
MTDEQVTKICQSIDAIGGIIAVIGIALVISIAAK